MKENLYAFCVFIVLISIGFTCILWYNKSYDFYCTFPLGIIHLLFSIYSLKRIYNNKKIDFLVIAVITLFAIIYYIVDYYYLHHYNKFTHLYYFSLLLLIIGTILCNSCREYYKYNPILDLLKKNVFSILTIVSYTLFFWLAFLVGHESIYNFVIAIPLYTVHILFFILCIINIYNSRKIGNILIGIVLGIDIIYYLGDFLWIYTPELKLNFYVILIVVSVSVLLRNYYGGFYNKESIDEKFKLD